MIWGTKPSRKVSGSESRTFKVFGTGTIGENNNICILSIKLNLMNHHAEDNIVINKYDNNSANSNIDPEHVQSALVWQRVNLPQCVYDIQR